MNNLEQLQNKIRELVPSLMELSFGCEVECIFGEGTEIVLFECGKCPKHKTAAGCEKSIYNDCYPDDAYYLRYGYEDDGFGTYVARAKDVQNKEKYTILGHPIQLHHVLQAIETIKCKSCKGSGDNSTEMGWRECEQCGGDKYELPEKYIGTMFKPSDILDGWDLNKPLSEQTPETINFLWEILSQPSGSK